jgi:diguanylate cyclase (GGDEF)-like protein/PAS domain S-box-containing protein
MEADLILGALLGLAIAVVAGWKALRYKSKRRLAEVSLRSSDEKCRILVDEVKDYVVAEIDLRELNTKALEQQWRSFDTALSSIFDHAYTFDRERRFRYVNQPLMNLWGLTLQDALGKNLFELPYPHELAKRIDGQIQQVFATGQKLSDITEYTSPSGIAQHFEYFFCPVVGGDGTVEFVSGASIDVTTRKRAEANLREKVEELDQSNADLLLAARAERAMTQQMTYLAEHDVLTGLPNRSLLNDRIRQSIASAQLHGKQVAILCLDLDGFKHINDSLGHPAGDRLLQSLAGRLVDCVHTIDTVSRQGGDEFVVLLSEIDHADEAAVMSRSLMDVLEKAHLVGLHDLHITASIGVSIYPTDGLDAETLIKNADTAMYQSKENGRQSVQFFTPAMNVKAVERQLIEEHLRRALERREFTLHYQPKIDLGTGKITGVEALIRWIHPSRGFVPPAQFIPVAEDCGLIVPIGAWVLREACAQARAWADAGLPAITMAVNVSAMQFRNPSFLTEVFSVLRETGLKPRYLELELTESALMARAELTVSILRALRATGVRVAVDDFGTGYSSLSYLRRFRTRRRLCGRLSTWAEAWICKSSLRASKRKSNLTFSVLTGVTRRKGTILADRYPPSSSVSCLGARSRQG